MNGYNAIKLDEVAGTKYVLRDEGFNKFVTDIFNDMQDEDEPWAIAAAELVGTSDAEPENTDNE